MKKFLIEILILVAGIILLNLLVFISRETPRSNYFACYKDISTTSFFVGDSHVYNFTPSDSLGMNFYNLGYPSDNFLDMKRKIQGLLRSGVCSAGDTIYLQCDSHLFSDYRSLANNNDISGVYVNELTGIKNYYLPLLGVKPVLSLVTVTDKLLGRIGRSHGTIKLETKKDSLAVLLRVQDQYGSLSSAAGSFKDFRELIRYTKERKLVVYSVMYPVHPYYREKVESISKVGEIEAEVKKMCRDSNIPVLDGTRSLTGVENFLNQDHLSPIGSDRFINILKSDVKESSSL